MKCRGLQWEEKENQKENTDDNKSEKEQKTPGIGTELYVYKEDE